MFLRSLQTVANGEAKLDEEHRRALDLALRYFRESAPKHTADEEESLFPRLQGLKDEELQSALMRVGELERDHREADGLHRRVEELGTAWLEANELGGSELAEFRSAVTRLGNIYPHHIEIEDRILFPAAARALSLEQKAQIAAEMAGRRSVKLTSL